MSNDEPDATPPIDRGGREPAPQAEAAAPEERAVRRAALGELARLALLAPAMAVLIDPEKARAAS